LSDSAIENSPYVQEALKYQDLTLDEIRAEAEQLLLQAGKDPQLAEDQVNAVIHDVQQAAQQIARHPEHGGQILNIALQRLFRRGEVVANEIDREALIKLLNQRTDLSEEEVKQLVERWEAQFEDVKQQTQQARDLARQKAEEFRQQAEEKAQEIYAQAQQRVTEMQSDAEAKLQEAAHEAEAKAREVAQAASETFNKVAAAIALAMIVGAVAAGLGGYLGAPETLPEIAVEATTQNTAIAHETSLISVTSDF
jgi:ElaB/YqjD/DUF883 family membrane-anchored ribosome-binding protein